MGTASGRDALIDNTGAVRKLTSTLRENDGIASRRSSHRAPEPYIPVGAASGRDDLTDNTGAVRKLTSTLRENDEIASRRGSHPENVNPIFLWERPLAAML
ncbi:hypothetical protein EH243_13230 [Amphritea opalescens]|uniref:Uncharacterized protein n=1 Tax=Amphritea opalescens TaxID=2490544 RepID=A0A430KP24_9GAMM|nr:hypothetical protein [Amphritea opalescens]RTE65202.1 hypothetical protein EH243_13230 [Amphritea opalescens]